MIWTTVNTVSWSCCPLGLQDKTVDVTMTVKERDMTQLHAGTFVQVPRPPLQFPFNIPTVVMLRDLQSKAPLSSRAFRSVYNTLSAQLVNVETWSDAWPHEDLRAQPAGCLLPMNSGADLCAHSYCVNAKMFAPDHILFVCETFLFVHINAPAGLRRNKPCTQNAHVLTHYHLRSLTSAHVGPWIPVPRFFSPSKRFQKFKAR